MDEIKKEYIITLINHNFDWMKTNEELDFDTYEVLSWIENDEAFLFKIKSVKELFIELIDWTNINKTIKGDRTNTIIFHNRLEKVLNNSNEDEEGNTFNIIFPDLHEKKLKL